MSVFFMVAIIVVARATAASVTHWVDARSAERRTRERYALLAKLAEQPRESAEIVIALLREEDAKEEQRRLEQRPERRRAKRAEGMQGGLALIAVGAGLAFFLSGLDTSGQRVWPIGLMLVLMGLVLFGFAYLSKVDSSTKQVAAGRPGSDGDPAGCYGPVKSASAAPTSGKSNANPSDGSRFDTQ